MMLADRLPAPPPPGGAPDADAVYAAIEDWAADDGLRLYPHQAEALIEIASGSNVILSTPTGSGKSLVATGAHAIALADDRTTFYTAPIKALVSEKFFALCDIFGPANVGMMTGDARVNDDAPIICCTAEILANMALRDGDRAADRGHPQHRAPGAVDLLLLAGAAARHARRVAVDQPGAGLRRALHPGR